MSRWVGEKIGYECFSDIFCVAEAKATAVGAV
jgi:hypothetical protein